MQDQSQDDGLFVNGKEGREEHGLRQRKKQQESYRRSSSNTNTNTPDVEKSVNQVNGDIGEVQMGNMNKTNNNSTNKNNSPIFHQTSTSSSSASTSQNPQATPMSTTPRFHAHTHTKKFNNVLKLTSYISRRKNLLAIFFLYIFVGAIQSFVSGSLVGLLICAIYKSGAFKMNTWIPCVYGIIITLYNVITSYSLTIAIL
ncbi:unnamed protein product [Ambrosiozyma monospora]|uniref:Unnamed protein product n=1 Tax=Ambrosiozyma monospora TaxID=43982 RepID=A0ACB5UCU4_AMBMO|nr:unnamed protein product [Ambrosiozyma monospora]